MRYLKALIFCGFNLVFLSVNAQLQTGVWRGVVNESANCFIEVGETTFVEGVVAPINEKVLIVVGSHTFSAYHPRAVDRELGHVSIDLNAYESLLSEKDSLFAMSLTVERLGDVLIPNRLVVFEQGYDGSVGEKIECRSFVKVAD